MIASRLCWAAWALIPVGVVAYHFGPGQIQYVHDRAASVESKAVAAEDEAITAQESAYGTHLLAIDARRSALLASSPDAESKAMEATKAEDRAYAQASVAWKKAADRYGEVQTILGEASPDDARAVRLAKARATARSGEIWTGIAELEGLIDELETNGKAESPMSRTAREELATAYYYGARLLRLSGMPAQEWHIESGMARQQFRYLAEHSLTKGDEEFAKNCQRNLELVLNLEQASLVEIQGKPLPKESPCNCKDGNRPSKSGKGKKPMPPRTKQDARGAGGAEEIRDGW